MPGLAFIRLIWSTPVARRLCLKKRGKKSAAIVFATHTVHNLFSHLPLVSRATRWNGDGKEHTGSESLPYVLTEFCVETGSAEIYWLDSQPCRSIRIPSLSRQLKEECMARRTESLAKVVKFSPSTIFWQETKIDEPEPLSMLAAFWSTSNRGEVGRPWTDATWCREKSRNRPHYSLRSDISFPLWPDLKYRNITRYSFHSIFRSMNLTQFNAHTPFTSLSRSFSFSFSHCGSSRSQ